MRATKRQLESAKKQIIAARNKIDSEARSRRRVPWWREFVYRLGWREPRRDWLARWERHHAESLRRATHAAVQAAKRGTV